MEGTLVGWPMAGVLAGKTLLIVDDNTLVRQELTSYLQQEGCMAVSAPDGRDALAYLRGGLEPDVILLDMLTPTVDGWQFLAERDRNRLLASIPVIIMTGIGVASPEWAASLGATGYLRKPIETEDLLREVTRCCRG